MGKYGTIILLCNTAPLAIIVSDIVDSHGDALSIMIATPGVPL